MWLILFIIAQIIFDIGIFLFCCAMSSNLLGVIENVEDLERGVEDERDELSKL